MRVVLQRVTRGEVYVAGELKGEIDNGLVALVGIAQDDGPRRGRAPGAEDGATAHLP